MLVITSKSPYALRALSELARRGDATPVPIGDLARARDIPAQFLEGLFATLRRAGDAIAVEGVGFDRTGTLQLVLRHPVRESEDLHAAVANGTAHLPAFDATHDWIVELTPADHRWRIVGRWKANAGEVALQPALGPGQ